MTNSLPYKEKKRDRLKRLEKDLSRLMERGATDEKLLGAAEEIRDCRVRVLKAVQSQIPQMNAEERNRFLRLGEQIRLAAAVTPEQVLAEFQAGQSSEPVQGEQPGDSPSAD